MAPSSGDVPCSASPQECGGSAVDEPKKKKTRRGRRTNCDAVVRLPLWSEDVIALVGSFDDAAQAQAPADLSLVRAHLLHRDKYDHNELAEWIKPLWNKLSALPDAIRYDNAEHLRTNMHIINASNASRDESSSVQLGDLRATDDKCTVQSDACLALGTCPKGCHEWKNHTAEVEGSTCSSCHRAFAPGFVYNTCRNCTYNICTFCQVNA